MISNSVVFGIPLISKINCNGIQDVIVILKLCYEGGPCADWPLHRTFLLAIVIGATVSFWALRGLP